MATRIEDTKDRITRAALAVFSAKGFASATTREIASEAGVNEVTLFRHFGKKENLFFAVIERHSVVPVIQHALKSELTGDYRTDLATIARHILTVWEDRRELIMIMLNEAQSRPDEISLIVEIPKRLRAYLASYLEGLHRQGRVRRLNFEACAQAFVNGLFSHFLMSRVFGAGFHPYSTEDYVDAFVDVFARGTMSKIP